MRWVGPAFGVLGLLVGIAGVTAHFIEPVSTPATIIASFTPLTVLAVLLAGVLFALSRRWIAVMVALTVTAVGVWSQVPLYRASAAAVAADHDIRLMQANIKLGQADPVAIVDTVRSESVDVLTVIELTDGARAGLQQAGLSDQLPYAATFPRAGGGRASTPVTRWSAQCCCRASS
ncbi:MAG: Endonuclease/exonuclease/phosphatase [Mycobacterium sp.]|nr:Endonuclease/exonuclease/phosphatase [Mycobacterium sp.]